MTRSKISLVVLAIGAVALLVGFTTARDKKSAVAANLPESSGALALQNDFVGVVHAVLPSVVQIETAAGLGSGIIFDTKGDIVTNDHVVGDPPASSFKVTTSNGHTYAGKLVGAFPDDDLAVIKISASGLKPATFADSGNLEVGDLAIAIGNPLGLTSSVTEGIVSALGRAEEEDTGVTLVDTIQTSAAINPGNSGGALVDLNGRVIGIPTLAATDTELGTTASGIGFAIPSNVVTDIASQIIKYGHVVDSHRPYLGIGPSDTMGATGVYVSTIAPGGPADKAGIKVGDVIVAINGSPTPTTSDLSTVEANLTPGQKVKLKITHQDGTTATVALTIGTYPGSTPAG